MINQHRLKPELPDTVWWKSPTLNMNKISEMVYGAHVKVHLWDV